MGQIIEFERNDGAAFERAVERWLRRRHNASATERRMRHRGKVALGGWECDVHATIPRAWRPVAIVSASCFAMCPLALTTAEVAIVLLVAGLLSFVWSLATFATPRHVWVECKDRRTKVGRVDVLKLVEASRDVAARVDASWRAEELWVVSSRGFERDALVFAKDRGVRCWISSAPGEFIEVRR